MNKDEYNEVVSTYTKHIHRYLLKSLKDPDAVKDIMQESFIKLWQYREQVEVPKAKSWLFITAHRFMLKDIQRNNALVSIESMDEEKEMLQQETFSTFDVKEIIDKCVDSLPPIQKSILLFRDLEGYNYKEIADMLDITEEKVRVYLFRSRQKIKNMIKSVGAIV